MSTLDLTADLIDVRDIIARFEELDEAREALRTEFDEIEANEGVDFDNWERNQIGYDEDEAQERAMLESLLAELNGMGGDEQWRGDWYPVTLIKDSYFEEYAQELAEDVGAVNKDAAWPNNCIDWTAAAEMLQQDYSTVDIGESTYWTR